VGFAEKRMGERKEGREEEKGRKEEGHCIALHCNKPSPPGLLMSRANPSFLVQAGIQFTDV
jgi:hypothetical protein